MPGLVRLCLPLAPPSPQDPTAERNERQDDDDDAAVPGVAVAVGPLDPRLRL